MDLRESIGALKYMLESNIQAFKVEAKPSRLGERSEYNLLSGDVNVRGCVFRHILESLRISASHQRGRGKNRPDTEKYTASRRLGSIRIVYSRELEKYGS